MLTNLLTETLPEGGRYVGIGEAALYALIGFLVVFAGIAFLILIVWAIGKLMNQVNALGKVEKDKTKMQRETVSESPTVAEADDISEETVAVITAALMAYYQQTNPKCEFTVRRIKRI